jgi:NAD+ kinase
VVVIGGDGHMLDTIRAIRPCVPIIGINAGNLGMLLNDAHPTAIRTKVSEGTPFDIHLLPLLEIEIMGLDGKWRPEKYYAFNDVTFGRGFGTRADKIRVEVRGRRPRTIPEVVCDGIVVASPAGSHAYAYALKAPGQLLETPVLTIVPCAPFRPREWQYSTVTDDHEVILTAIDPHIRPARAVVDSLSLGDCLAIRVRMSRSEGVELAFIRGCSLADKIADRQFPFTFC